MKIANLKFGDLQIVETGNLFGPMSYDKEFYDEGTSEIQRRADFMSNRMNLGAKYGFCGRNMFIVSSNPTTGDFLEITKKEVEENYSGFPDATATSDILLISSETPDVVIGGLHKEMPVLVVYDYKEGILGAMNCSYEAIDREMPIKLIDTLTGLGLRESDIYTYISSCTEDIPFITEPDWLQGPVWDDFIEIDRAGTYHINPKEVIKDILSRRGISNTEASSVNVLYDYDYFYGDEEGYNFSGAFIMGEDNSKRYRLTR